MLLFSLIAEFLFDWFCGVFVGLGFFSRGQWQVLFYFYFPLVFHYSKDRSIIAVAKIGELYKLQYKKLGLG